MNEGGAGLVRSLGREDERAGLWMLLITAISIGTSHWLTRRSLQDPARGGHGDLNRIQQEVDKAICTGSSQRWTRRSKQDPSRGGQGDLNKIQAGMNTAI